MEQEIKSEQFHIKRSLFIGLGGMGIMCLKYAKAKLLGEYGEIPPMVRFLGFDTDAMDGGRPLQFDGKEVRLEETECLALAPADMGLFLQGNSELGVALPKKNLKYASSIAVGLAQIRSFGRLAIAADFPKIEASLSAAAAQIKGFESSPGDRYVAADNGIAVHFCFSLAGGTGSGMFIDMAYLTKMAANLLPQDFSIAYMVLPDIFASMGSPIEFMNAGPNAYAALKELEFIMDGRLEGEEIRYGGPNRTVISGAPFDIPILIGNRNSAGLVYDSPDQLAEMIGSTLSLNTGDSGYTSSLWPNICHQMAETGFVTGKKPRYVGVGYSEVTYDGSVLKKLYACIVAKEILSGLLMDDEAEVARLETHLDAWNITENGRDHRVLDAILSGTLLANPESVDKLKPGVGIQLENKSAQFIQSLKNRAEKDSEANLHILMRKKEDIEKYLSALLDSGAGVGTARNVVAQLLARLKDYHRTKIEERDRLIRESDDLRRENLETKFNISEAEKSFLLGRKGKIKEACLDYLAVTKREGIIAIETVRREKAIVFFGRLIDSLEKKQKEIDGLYKTLSDVLSKEYAVEIEKLSQIGHRLAPFIIPLHEKFVNELNVGNLPSASDFLKSLDGATFSAWISKKAEECKALLDAYVMNLEGAKRYDAWTIDDAIAELRTRRGLDVTELLTSLDKLSAPVVAYRENVMGVIPPVQSVIGTGDPDSSAISHDEFTQVFAHRPRFTSTRDGHRINILKLQCSFPAFLIDKVIEYRTKYASDDSPFDFHIDANWEKKMQEDGFDIVPTVDHGE